MEALSIIISPLLTEKSNILREGKNKKYAFKVDARANKFQIRSAVEALFNVKTVDCAVINVGGKVKSMGMRGGRGAKGRTSSWKKAYVTLLADQKIDQFEGV